MIILTCREFAKELGEKGIIVFSDVEHVVLKGMLCTLIIFRIVLSCQEFWFVIILLMQMTDL